MTTVDNSSGTLCAMSAIVTDARDLTRRTDSLLNHADYVTWTNLDRRGICDYRSQLAHLTENKKLFSSGEIVH